MVKRTHTVLRRMSETRAPEPAPGMPQERLAFVWPLTRELCSLSKHYDAEQRLQRHVTRLIRRKS